MGQKSFYMIQKSLHIENWRNDILSNWIQNVTYVYRKCSNCILSQQFMHSSSFSTFYFKPTINCAWCVISARIARDSQIKLQQTRVHTLFAICSFPFSRSCREFLLHENDLGMCKFLLWRCAYRFVMRSQA